MGPQVPFWALAAADIKRASLLREPDFRSLALVDRIDVGHRSLHPSTGLKCATGKTTDFRDTAYTH